MIAALALAASSAFADTAPLAVSVRTGSSAYVSNERMIGGTGASLGVAAESSRAYLRGDVGLLVGLGSVLEVCVGAGVTRGKRWAPAAGPVACMLTGTQTSFLTDDHPLPIRTPATTVGLSVEPLRFDYGKASISALAIDAGIGTDWWGSGWRLSLGFFRLSVEP